MPHHKKAYIAKDVHGHSHEYSNSLDNRRSQNSAYTVLASQVELHRENMSLLYTFHGFLYMTKRFRLL